MIKSFYIFDDIIDKSEQDNLLSFVNSNNAIWKPHLNITGEFGGSVNENLPGYAIFWDSMDKELLSIVNKIEVNSIQKINMDYVKTYRYKINKTTPIESYNTKNLIHVDIPINHIAIIYYINDSDGDTVLLNNKNGNNAESLSKNFKSINVKDFEILKKVTPKKGRVLIFDGNLYHYGEYPSIGNRYVINYNIAAKPKTKNIL